MYDKEGFVPEYYPINVIERGAGRGHGSPTLVYILAAIAYNAYL